MKNILLLVVDCARTEKTLMDLPLSVPGTRRSAKLPFLDDLRRAGKTWTQLIATSSTTTPNFASLFTGLLPAAHGIIEHSRHSLAPGITTLAELLKDGEYTTCAEVTGPLIPEAGLDRGFDHYRYRDRTEYLHTGFRKYLRALLPSLQSPWFLCLHLWEVHAPCQNPPPFNDPKYGLTPYDRALSLVDHQLGRLFEGLDLSRTALVYTADHGERLVEDYALDRRLGGSEWQALKSFHDFLKHARGRLDYEAWFRFAEERLGEATARIFAHNVLGHGFHLTEEQVRIPLVIFDPERCPAGTTDSGLESQKDLFGTLLDLAGIHWGTGRSLLKGSGPDRVYVEANGSGGKKHESRCYLRGARTGQWKYWHIEGGQEERSVLWDLERDPREVNNCIEDHPEVAADLCAFVDACLVERDEPRPVIDREKAKTIEEKMRELGYL